MSFVDVVDIGIVVRLEPLNKLGLGIDAMVRLLEFDPPLGISDNLVSFGPLFGIEAADELCRRLQELGLEYIDDFFIFTGDFPEWCKFKVSLQEKPVL
jgi:hypothetical protein